MGYRAFHPQPVILRPLLLALAVSFGLGALTHAGVDVPLGVTTIDEPTIVPATVVEGITAAALSFAAFAEITVKPYARLALRLALRIGIAGVLLGMFALAVGRGTRTELNDVFHVVALIMLLVAWQIGTSGRAAGSCWPGRRLTRRAT
ncbi:MAG TPA: hypothetical protein VGO14_10120 [Solirubrobacteraceae bacterium]|jgi:hypothetical protein|nr:hypothetical protein [Solirubrobacteraceae bacterium]